ncbi:MAG: ATP-dependent DNA helicase RecG [Spirochaetales bacterium]|nr:ATP-dependent DNA helicase RecG [Spirochaetales bacterium]
MTLRELEQSVETLSGVGKAVAARLARLGVYSIADLLVRFPRDYDDRTEPRPFSEWSRGRVNTVARVVAHEWFGFGRMRTLKLVLDDGSARAVAPCFNRPFLADRHPEGSLVKVLGSFAPKFGELQGANATLESAEEGEGPSNGILPVYSLTEGLAQGALRSFASRALSMYGERLEDELPPSLRERRRLLPISAALRGLHFPEGRAGLEEARRSLAWSELFFFQLLVKKRAASRRERPVERRPITGELKRRLLARLPFEPTSDQLKVVAEIEADLASPVPMARLLQGDVGSGKTLVAFLAALDVIEAGGQVAVMAPTELLARQHAESAARLLEPAGVRLAFLSGNARDSARRPLLSALASGEVDLVIGTQALFSEDVAYRRLSLVVVDEQHRFGVVQRAALARKGSSPDLLLMSATPIPRTLALTVYGDLSVSVIRTMPPGRTPVATHLARMGNERKVYDFVRRELEAGHQAYFVYPAIEGDGESELKDAVAMQETLAREVYPDRRVGIVHSRVNDAEKRETMEAFRSGGLDILVATSVVEVGVDVPNATCMVIEHAERFGLAALHQLRGRVGRSSLPSYCFLVYAAPLAEDSKRRLMALKESGDGFELAEEDLRIRGPGDLVGTAQSGAFRLAVADPIRDSALLEEAREDAAAIIEADPNLLRPEHALLRGVVASGGGLRGERASRS